MIKFRRQRACAQRRVGSGVNNFGLRGRIIFLNFIAYCFAYETNLDQHLNYQHITSIMPILCYFNS